MMGISIAKRDGVEGAGGKTLISENVANISWDRI